MKEGFIRGAAIKIIQQLTQGNAFAALGFTVGVEVIPALLKVVNGELTIEQAIDEVGVRAFTSGVVTTLVILFPPIGVVLLSTSAIQAIWSQISPEWKNYLLNIAKTTVTATEQGVQAGVVHLNKNPWDFLGSSSASSIESSAEFKAMQSELDMLLD